MVVETFHNPALPCPAKAVPDDSSSVAADNPISNFRSPIHPPMQMFRPVRREIWHAGKGLES
jgi:hypothetical protein